MAAFVKVNLFSVSRPEETPILSDTLRAYEALPLGSRLRSEIRLDRVEFHAANEQLPITWELDFVKRREVGPGKMSDREEVSDVGLEPDELFGEETAALYVPSKKWLLVLGNKHGVGPAQMANYFNALDPGNTRSNLHYRISPLIDQSALEKMQAMRQFSSIEITASVGAFNAQNDVGESVLEAASRVTAHRVHLKLMANEKYKKGLSLGFESVRNFLDSMLRNGEDVDTLKVTSSDNNIEAQDRVIDLIEHKVSSRFSSIDLEIVGHRYTYDSKIKMLRRACKSWLTTMG